MDSSQKQYLREIRAHGTSIFPCAYYLTTGNITQLQVKHHWHEEIEILYLKSGKYRLFINMESLEIRDRCFVFVNRGELHDLRSISQDYEERAVVFDPQMLRFYNFDSIDEHILLPLMQGKLTFPRILTCSHPAFEALAAEYEKISDAFCRNQQVSGTGDQIYTNDIISQLQIKASILQFLAILMEHNLMCHDALLENQRIESIKTVLAYIRQHYGEKLYVQDLSALVSMNEQYFCRFFKKAIGKSPIDYLNDYRLNKVIDLLENTERPVTDISLDCGFNNMGNFQRLFRRKTGTTPLQYRKTAGLKKSE